MKDLSLFLSVTGLVILFGYITYEGTKQKDGQWRVTDEAVALPEVNESSYPLQVVSPDLPASISFAGEDVPLNIPDVRERFDRELQINTYLHSSTIFMIKRASRWLPQIEAILKEHGIPDDFKYMPMIESALINDVSPREAVGFWQILKGSGKELGLEITKEVDERYDPLKSTVAACKYLQQAYSKFNNWTLAAASYDRGMYGLRNSLENQKVNSYYDLYLNDETSRYIFRILAIKEIYEHQDKYGFKLKSEQLYQEEKLRFVEVTETVKNLVAFAEEQGTNYKLLKRHNPWLREQSLTVRKNKTYRIALPAE